MRVCIHAHISLDKDLDRPTDRQLDVLIDLDSPWSWQPASTQPLPPFRGGAPAPLSEEGKDDGERPRPRLPPGDASDRSASAGLAAAAGLSAGRASALPAAPVPGPQTSGAGARTQGGQEPKIRCSWAHEAGLGTSDRPAPPIPLPLPVPCRRCECAPGSDPVPLTCRPHVARTSGITVVLCVFACTAQGGGKPPGRRPSAIQGIGLSVTSRNMIKHDGGCNNHNNEAQGCTNISHITIRARVPQKIHPCM